MPSPIPSRRDFLQQLFTGLASSAAWSRVEEALGKIAAAIKSTKPFSAPTVWTGAVTTSTARVKAWVPQAGPAQLILTTAADPQRRLVIAEQPLSGASNGA